MHINGSIDEIQLIAEGHSTQTSDIFVIRNSSAVTQFSVNNVGNTLIAGELKHTGPKIGLFSATPVIQSAAYTPTNVTTDRSYDANSTSVDEMADVLGTLIADLQLMGIIG